MKAIRCPFKLKFLRKSFFTILKKYKKLGMEKHHFPRFLEKLCCKSFFRLKISVQPIVIHPDQNWKNLKIFNKSGKNFMFVPSTMNFCVIFEKSWVEDSYHLAKVHEYFHYYELIRFSRSYHKHFQFICLHCFEIWIFLLTYLIFASCNFYFVRNKIGFQFLQIEIPTHIF